MKEGVKLMNLHNHTRWSDGVHSPEELIEHAIAEGMSKIGITDHYETSKLQPYKCLQKEKLNAYIRELEKLKEMYKEQIEIYIGIEVCMSKSYCKLQDLPYELFNQMDFLLVEYVEDSKWKDTVKLDELRRYIKPLHIPVGLAHTDLMPLVQRYGIKKVVKRIKKLGLFWELNVSNRYHYAIDFLDKQDSEAIKELITLMKKYDIKITVGTDTHQLEKDYNQGEVLRAHKFLEGYYEKGLTY